MGKSQNRTRQRVSSRKRHRGNKYNLKKGKTTSTLKFISEILIKVLDKCFLTDDVESNSFVSESSSATVTVNEMHGTNISNSSILDSTDTNDLHTSDDVLQESRDPSVSDTLFLHDVSSNLSDKKDTYNDIEISGRRILDMNYFFEKLKTICNHAPQYGCSINNLNIYKESKRGLHSTFHMHCNMCSMNFQLENSNKNINLDSVQGAMGIGIGYFNCEELFSVMDIPYMSAKLYAKCHDTVCDGWETTATKLMEEAAKEEAEHAIQTGNVDKDGVPLVAVIADGCWSKRSYRTNYSALSGAAAIVGYHTSKVLYIAVKNKFCSICSKTNSKPSTSCIAEHVCYKNYEGSSTGMEAQSLVEGFRESEKMYGIRYYRMIADGDSSTYKKILESRPYKSITVEKIECRNHLLRNFCNKLKALTTETRYPIKIRKLIGKNIMRFRTAVLSVIAHRKQNRTADSPIFLKKDIDNSIFHIFGQHANCDDYFCKRGTEDENHIPTLKSCAELFNKLHQIVSYISNQSRSLIEDLDSNRVEQFNSIVAKFVGGKRINFSQRRSYTGRCKAAVVSFNSKRPHYYYHKSVYGTSPGKLVKKMEIQRRKLVEQRRIRNVNKQKKKQTKIPVNRKKDDDYGENCLKTDLDDVMLDLEKQKFLRNLERTEEEKSQLERSTRLQAESGFWLEERRKLLTASSFHSVCTRRPTTPCANLVKSLLYKASSLNIPSLAHGKKFEADAILQLEQQENVTIRKCGLFIHKDFCFFGATPDGLVENDLIVEVKCPFSAHNMPPKQVIIEKKIKFWTHEKGEFKINSNDKWYFQIQGQLQVTGKKGCLFGVWTGSKHEMMVEYILKKDDFWKERMEAKLVNFYMYCILPELVDPRFTRGLPIREPAYIEEAINAKTTSKRPSSPEQNVSKKKTTARKKLF